MKKQPSIGVLRKRCSENMQQIYRRTATPKCDFNKVDFNKVALRCSKNLQQIYRRTPIPKCDFNKVDFNKVALRCSENMQQIYRRTPMPKCGFDKSHQHVCSPVNLLHIFRTPFPKNTPGGLPLIWTESWN